MSIAPCLPNYQNFNPTINASLLSALFPQVTKTNADTQEEITTRAVVQNSQEKNYSRNSVAETIASILDDQTTPSRIGYQQKTQHLLTCSSCKSDDSRSWQIKFTTPTTYICEACYTIAENEQANSSHTCLSCESNNSRRWHKDFVDPTKHRCLTCYRKAQKHEE